MKALTICQPYAHLIVRGEKRVENQGWPTRYRGPLAIHAGKSRSWLDPDDIPEFEAEGDPIAFGAVVGVARLVDVLHVDRIRSGLYDAKYPWIKSHEHTEGTWCWVLEDVRRIDPVPWSGSQGLWDIPDTSLPDRAPHIRDMPGIDPLGRATCKVGSVKRLQPPEAGDEQS